MPTSLESHKVVACSLGVLERLTQFIEGAETQVEICNHIRAAGPGWAITWFAGTHWGTGYCYKEEHECCAEDYCHDLVVHAAEGVVSLVELEKSRNGGG